MKRMTYFVMALALVLGLAQCKKEKLETPQNEGNSVMITLDVKGDNNAKVEVNPPYVTFGTGDEIVVACNGHYVGTLKHNGTNFSGSVTNATPGKPLFFYFFGNVTPQYFGNNKSNCSVYTGDQTGNLPVISMGASIDRSHNNDTVYFSDTVNYYEAQLHNKCSLMKFNVTTPSTALIFIDGMNNFVEVNFAAPNGADNGFSYSQKYDGMIKMKMKGQEGDTKTYWAIVLPQGPVEASDAYTADYSYIGTRPAIGRIGSNQYFSDGVDMTVNTSHNPLATPLTFEAKTAGATVSLSKDGSDASSAPDVILYTSTDGITWTPYTVGTTTITLTNVGDKVMFRGTNNRFATGTEAYHNFSLGGDCYVYGNIMSLIDSTGYVTATSLGDNPYTFESLFAGCTGLYTHSLKTLKLPATGLATYCYSYMFKDCTNLTVAPDLPADVLKSNCYESMFYGCSSLTASPVLWAEDLVSNCYASMFTDCTSLNRVTCLATSGINVGASTYNWLSNAGPTITGENPPMFYRNLDPEVPVVEDPDDPENPYKAGTYWPMNNNGIPANWDYE